MAMSGTRGGLNGFWSLSALLGYDSDDIYLEVRPTDFN